MCQNSNLVAVGPPPRAPAATCLRAADATLEFERTVNATGLISAGDTQFSVGVELAGQRVTIRLEGDVGHVVCDGVEPPPTAGRLVSSKENL
jgi:hypothetical protein